MNPPTQDIFEQVLLRPVVGRLSDDGASTALLSWVAAQQGDRLVQVYVDDVLTDISVDSSQREMWLHLDRTRTVRVELLAVDPADALTDHAADLHGWSPRFVQQASLAAVRDEALPIDTRAVVTVDGADDHGHPLWRSADYRSGFGALFGVGEFGRDSATGPGFGLGGFGAGPFGADGHAWRWQRDDLAPGSHSLEIRLDDSTGRAVGQMDAPQNVLIDAVPAAARSVQLDDLTTLRWIE